MSYSLCMMVKDEGEYLDFCLQNADKNYNQFICVDTGSIDDTVDILEKHKAEIIHKKFNDNFASIRNSFFDYADTEWILILDGDETTFNSKYLNTDVLNSQSRLCYYVPRYNFLGNGHFYADQIIRIMLNSDQIKYSGTVFEMLDVPEDSIGYYNKNIYHFGYIKNDAFLLNKMRKYIKMGNQKIKDDLKKYNKIQSIYVFSMLSLSSVILNNLDDVLYYCSEAKKYQVIPWLYIFEGGVSQLKEDFDIAEKIFKDGLNFCKAQINDNEVEHKRRLNRLFYDKMINKLGQLCLIRNKYDEAIYWFDQIDSNSRLSLSVSINNWVLYGKMNKKERQAEIYRNIVDCYPFLLQDAIQKKKLRFNLSIISDVTDQFKGFHNPVNN